MTTQTDPETLWQAFTRKDSRYEGTFIVAVKTTGICCRPTCRVRPPRRENVEFFPSVSDAVRAGYRPCKRCRPEASTAIEPPIVKQLKSLSVSSGGVVTESDLQDLGIDSSTARRNFKRATGLTFAAWQKRSSEPAVLTEAYIATPLGRMRAFAADHALLICDFEDRKGLATAIAKLESRFTTQAIPARADDHPIIRSTREQLDQYFAGTLKNFSLPLDPPTQPFLRLAWDALLEIPYGQTRSYAAQAVSMGRPTAVRAVARANGQNYISIIIPCHRVIGSNGALTGYGGGLPRKEWLLQHERRHSLQRR